MVHYESGEASFSLRDWVEASGERSDATGMGARAPAGCRDPSGLGDVGLWVGAGVELGRHADVLALGEPSAFWELDSAHVTRELLGRCTQANAMGSPARSKVHPGIS